MIVILILQGQMKMDSINKRKAGAGENTWQLQNIREII